MSILVVIENPEEVPLKFKGMNVVAAKTYLTDSSFSDMKGTKVFNICRSYRYQSIGYYVSLLAEARNHKPIPNITTIQDMKSVGLIRLVSEEVEEQILNLALSCIKKSTSNFIRKTDYNKLFENINLDSAPINIQNTILLDVVKGISKAAGKILILPWKLLIF